MMSKPSMIGPSLPPHLSAAKSTKSDDEPQVVNGPQTPSTDEEASKASYGPSLPPGMTYDPSIPEDSKDISVDFIWITKFNSAFAEAFAELQL